MDVTVSGRVESPPFPKLYIIRKPWHLDSLKALPQAELRAWHDNMEAGLDSSRNYVRFFYTWGGLTQKFVAPPDMLVLPDGNVKYLGKSGDEDGRKPDEIFPKAEDVIRAVLKNRMKVDRTYNLGLRGTEKELIDEMVAAQMELVKQLGYERHGSFVRTPSSVRHLTSEQYVDVTVPLDRYIMDKEDKKTPLMFFDVRAIKEVKGDIVCSYHTHLSENFWPTQGDILLMQAGGEPSIIIASRQKGRKDAYRVVEWRPKEGANLAVELGSAGMRSLYPQGWMGKKEVNGFLERLFDSKEYNLRLEEGRMVYEERKL